MSERKKHIAVLNELLAWMEMGGEFLSKDDPFYRTNEERKEAVKYAISSLETDEAYQLEYEPTTKNDLVVDWDELKRKILMEVDGGTDDAWLAYGEVCDRISNSIDEFVADMRGNAKRKGEPIEGNNESYNCENWIP